MASSSDIPILARMLSDENHEELRLRIIESLEKIGIYTDPVIVALINRLNDESPQIRAKAANVLSHLKDKSLQFLKEALIQRAKK